MQDDDVLVGHITSGIGMNSRWIIKRWRVRERNQRKVNKKKVAMFGSLSENNIHKNLINLKC